jgi:putative tryptophan/tyrosine transport system substrate-binding protein
MFVTAFPVPRQIAVARHLTLAFVCLALILPVARPTAQAQQPAPVHRIATLGADTTQVWDIFHRRLRELGYVEGQNLLIERRWSHGYEDRVPTLLAELLRVKPDVLVTSMLPPTARIEAAQCVPILAIAVWEPYGSCRAFPVARMSQVASAKEVGATHLRLARAAVPGASRFLVLTNSERPFLVEYVKELESAAASAGATLHALDVSGDPDVGNVAAAITREAPDVLIVGPSFMRPDARRQIVRFAIARGIPAIGSYVADGVVIAADYDWADLARRAADFVDQLLKGAKPADLSTGAPTRFEVIVDARVAKVLGLTIPESVLSQADRVLN